MNSVEDICKKLEIFRQILLTNKQKDDDDNLISGTHTELINGDVRWPDYGENIVDLVKNIFSETHQPNPLNSTFQTEPLDLSQKPNPSETKLESKTDQLPKRLWKPKNFDFDTFFMTCIKRFTANDVCNARCEMLYKDHYHCLADSGKCDYVMKGKDQLRQHGKRHSIAEELTLLEFKFCASCVYKSNRNHYHCSHDNCNHISVEVANMDRLMHVETAHCIIISKRTNNHSNINKSICPVKKRRKSTNNSKIDVKKELSSAGFCGQMSPMSSCSSDNQFTDFNTDSIMNTINRNNIFTILDHMSQDINKVTNSNDEENNHNNIVNAIKDHDKNYYLNGNCSRLFCNLKKSNHYHCQICDRGSSKKELYVRHLKQRHK